ncbi:hypothetical protein JTB14_022053 [Gonioctena quinquepunctata]|nr:hypothetical protein JTB14_022053 [Gonioctena quinquepunctata]
MLLAPPTYTYGAVYLFRSVVQHLDLKSCKGSIQEELENALEYVVRELADERENVLREEPIYEFDSDENVSDIDTEEEITQNLYSSDSEQSAEDIDGVSDDTNKANLKMITVFYRTRY